MVGALNQLHGVGGQAGLRQGLAHRSGEDAVGLYRLRAALQDDRIAALQGNGRRVRGYIGTGLVDDGDDADGNGDPADLQSAGHGAALQNPPDRIRQSRRFTEPIEHIIEDLLRDLEPFLEGGGESGRGDQVLRIGVEEFSLDL